jgi:hypothetical protein
VQSFLVRPASGRALFEQPFQDRRQLLAVFDRHQADGEGPSAMRDHEGGISKELLGARLALAAVNPAGVFVAVVGCKSTAMTWGRRCRLLGNLAFMAVAIGVRQQPKQHPSEGLQVRQIVRGAQHHRTQQPRLGCGTQEQLQQQ